MAHPVYVHEHGPLPVSECLAPMRNVFDILRSVIMVVGKVYGKERECSKLHPRSWKEPHLLHYQVLEGKPEHTGIEMHYDGCNITWSLMLMRPDEYEGDGTDGTYMRCLRKGRSRTREVS